ncbi:hypothetical protein [Streptomyces sp. DW26H14]|uniref:hypothetical protein n=1 Tax=Streptomyces sp. DW26H14 TaxID=3435395 RepID=UPI00403E35E1
MSISRRWAGLSLALLVLVIFPGLASLVAVSAAALLVWAAAQPVLVGVLIGAVVWARVRRTGWRA